MRLMPGPSRRAKMATAVTIALALAALAPGVAAAKSHAFLNTVMTQKVVGSTVPGNGDINPYGVAVVPRSTGHLVKGDVLVSNFNNSSNAQGTGTTIVQISPKGAMTVFASIMPSDVPQCIGGVGLTTALVALKSGWVVVGSLPTTGGDPATSMAGCLIVLGPTGHVTATISGGLINGPWDMTAWDNGDDPVLFVSNVLNGTVAANGKVVDGGTVVRVDIGGANTSMPHVTSERVIGSGFPEKTDPGALVIGPTGLALDSMGNLYVADTIANRIAVIPNAPTRMSASHKGRTVSQNGNLNGPLGLTIAENGNILALNSNDGNAVEITAGGHQVAVKLLDSVGAGTLFGLCVTPDHEGIYFVDDGSNNLQLLH
jgi:hypothetical protein